MSFRKQNRDSNLHHFAGRSHSLFWPLALAVGLTAICCTHPSAPANNQSSANQSTAQPTKANANIAAKPEQKASGSIDVTSTPPGARVLLVPTDEGGASEPQPKGVTPTTITGVAPGKYTIDIEKPGYRFYQTEIKVKAGATVKVSAALKRQ